MIKVVHIVNDLRMGGVCSVLFNLLSNSNKNEFDYEIVNLSGVEEPAMIDLFSKLNIKIHNLNYIFEEGYQLKDYYKKAFLERKYKSTNIALIDYISFLGAQILHFHTLPRELLLGKLVAKKKPVSLVFTDHTMRITSKELSFLSSLFIKYPFRKFYKNYFVIAVSEAVGNYLNEQKISTCLRGMKIITNKIANNTDRINYNKEGDLNFVYVSRISLAKGHLDLINAWALLPKLGCKLFIVGPDEMSGSVQKFYSEKNCLNEVVFTGPITNVAEFLMQMDVGIFPSYKEGLPIALLEMMQVGLPCAVSDIDEIKTIVNDKENCLQFKCGNISSIFEKIVELIENKNLREKIGRAASKTVESKYAQTTISLSKEYENVYKSLHKFR